MPVVLCTVVCHYCTQCDEHNCTICKEGYVTLQEFKSFFFAAFFFHVNDWTIKAKFSIVTFQVFITSQLAITLLLRYLKLNILYIKVVKLNIEVNKLNWTDIIDTIDIEILKYWNPWNPWHSGNPGHEDILRSWTSWTSFWSKVHLYYLPNHSITNWQGGSQRLLFV